MSIEQILADESLDTAAKTAAITEWNASQVAEATESLANKNKELLGEKKSAQTKAAEAAAEAKRIAEETAKKNGDIEALEKSWREKLTAREQELLTENQALMGTVTADKIDSVAFKLAAEISTVPSVMQKVITERLAIEKTETGFKTVVNDSNGQRSALSLDELKTEIMSNAEYAPLIKATNASGSGGANLSSAGGSGSSKRYSQMTTQEKAQHLKNKIG